VVVYRGVILPTPELPTRLAEQALPSEQVERHPLTVREAEQALQSEQRERRPYEDDQRREGEGGAGPQRGPARCRRSRPAG